MLELSLRACHNASRSGPEVIQVDELGMLRLCVLYTHTHTHTHTYTPTRMCLCLCVSVSVSVSVSVDVGVGVCVCVRGELKHQVWPAGTNAKRRVCCQEPLQWPNLTAKWWRSSMTYWITKSNMARFSAMPCFLWFAGILMVFACAANLQQVLKIQELFYYTHTHTHTHALVVS